MAFKDKTGQWTGFCVELWRHMALKMGSAYEFRELEFKEIEGTLRSGNADISVSPLYETVDRHRFLDFSVAIGSIEPAIAVLATRDPHPFLAALKVLLSWNIIEMGLLFLAVIFLAGFTFWIIERKSNPDHFGGHPVKGLVAGLYWVGSTLVSGFCTGVSLKSTSGRIIGLLWILAGAIAFSALTASLASSLIGRQQLLGYTYDMNAMRGMHLGAVTGTTQASLLGKLGGKFTLFDRTDQVIEALLARRIEGFFGNERLLAYEESKYRNKLSLHLTTLKKMRLAFALPQGSPLREGLNISLMEFMEGPEWDSLAHRYGLTRDLEPLGRKEAKGSSWSGN